MTSLSAGGLSLNNPAFRMLDKSSLDKMHVSEMPEEQYQKVLQTKEKILEMRHSKMPDTQDNPAYQNYAKVIVNGKVAAEIDNHGWVKTSNASAGTIRQAIQGAERLAGVESGPELAQARAEKVAAALGGEIVRSPTAITQTTFDGIEQPQAVVDDAALRSDPAFESLQKLKQARTQFLTQQLAQQ